MTIWEAVHAVQMYLCPKWTKKYLNAEINVCLKVFYVMCKEMFTYLDT